eukprot:TRINITY_DN1685_c0_g1_i3.p1 TRINITY_DN1685_c0_g1~~TRINITY_DN1685_c0_g1_i3.p1  ORF type:complete len:131 (-),score=25.73 TRINITY_DN1685_c0_g1_i3:161-520(-)
MLKTKQWYQRRVRVLSPKFATGGEGPNHRCQRGSAADAGRPVGSGSSPRWRRGGGDSRACPCSSPTIISCGHPTSRKAAQEERRCSSSTHPILISIEEIESADHEREVHSHALLPGVHW